MRADLTLNLGLRYEVDTDVKNVSRVRRDQPDRAAVPAAATRHARPQQLGPAHRLQLGAGRRAGRACTAATASTTTASRCEIQSLERGLDGRALPIEVRAGNVFFLDPATGQFPPFAPSTANPFTGFILPGAGASGINIIDNAHAEPDGAAVQPRRSSASCRGDIVLRVDGVHNLGTHFIIGRTVGEVFNPVVGGPDRVVNLESSVNTQYDALLVSAERRGDAVRRPRGLHALARRSTTPTTIRFRSPTARSIRTTCGREYGPTPNDQRHRFTLAAWAQAPRRRSASRRSGRWRPACRWTS